MFMCSLTLKESIITIIYFLLCLGLIFHGNNLIIDIYRIIGNYLGILSSAVFSKLIYYIVPSLSLSESQTVWIQIRSDILSVLIWF